VNNAWKILYRGTFISYIIDTKFSIWNTSTITTLDIRLILAITIARKMSGWEGKEWRERKREKRRKRKVLVCTNFLVDQKKFQLKKKIH
jgi:hypothetical protein